MADDMPGDQLAQNPGPVSPFNEDGIHHVCVDTARASLAGILPDQFPNQPAGGYTVSEQERQLNASMHFCKCVYSFHTSALLLFVELCPWRVQVNFLMTAVAGACTAVSCTLNAFALAATASVNGIPSLTRLRLVRGFELFP